MAATVSALLLSGWSASAFAKCSIHSADSIVAARYGECPAKRLVSFLHNNIVTPYSFQCAKKIQETCKAEGCDQAPTPEAKARCEGRYVDVLSHCEDELDGAALMAKCKDTHSWPVAAIPSSDSVVQGPADAHPNNPSDPAFDGATVDVSQSLPDSSRASQSATTKAPDARAPSSGGTPTMLPLDLQEVTVPARTAKSSRAGNPRFRR